MPNATLNKCTIAIGLKIWATFSNRAIDGILAFGRKNRSFQFRDLLWTEAEQLPELLARVRPHGAILSLTHVDYRKIREQLPVDFPLVSIGADTIAPHVGMVCSDDQAMVTLAVDHLRGAGYRRIAFVGWAESSGTQRRIALLRKSQRNVQVLNVTLNGPTEDLTAETTRELRAWLRELPTPVGLIAWSGAIAGHVQRNAEAVGLNVPCDLGIVSLVDDHPCLVGEPAISAMDVDGERLGAQAMSLLAAMLQGQPPPSQQVMVPPAGVIGRGSTAVAASAGDNVSAALRFIKENAMRGIVVKNVLATLPGIGRTRFYAEFTNRVGCSPADYIRRLKIDRAKQLLQTTELSVTRVAAMCGFASTTQFGDTFKREVGATPLGFRRGGR